MKGLHEKLRDYAEGQYPIAHLVDCTCKCGGRTFRLAVDEEAGVASRTSVGCEREHVLGDGADYLDEATLEPCECSCGLDVFELAVGVALYEDSDDVKWFYVGGRCTDCELAGCYGDWKNEAGPYREFLKRV